MMLFLRNFVSLTIILTLSVGSAFAAKPDKNAGKGPKGGSDGSDPEICDSNGNLKGWAKKHHSPDECEPQTNTAPVIVITAPEQGYSASTEFSIQFIAVATDTEDGDISSQTTWHSSIDGSIPSNTILSAGFHTITATAVDSGGLTSQDSVTVTIQAVPTNTPPSVTINDPIDGTSIEHGTPLTLAGAASDAEDGDLTALAMWSSSLDGTITSPVSLSVGIHTITFSVTDSEGLYASETVQISVTALNTAPSISILSPTPGKVLEEGQSLSLQAQANDLEDGDISSSIIWISSLDGELADITTLSLGEHTLIASITDSSGLSNQAETTVTVNASPPLLTSMNISWDRPLFREDGAALNGEEIAGYEITLVNTAGDEFIFTISDGYTTVLETDPMEPGEYSLIMKSVDSGGRYSSATAPMVFQHP